MKNQTNYVAGHLDKGQDGLLYSGGIEGEQAKRRYASLCKYLFLHFFSDVIVEASRNLEWLQYILDKGTDFEPGRLDAEISEAFRSPPVNRTERWYPRSPTGSTCWVPLGRKCLARKINASLLLIVLALC